jgi:hypothetical protein
MGTGDGRWEPMGADEGKWGGMGGMGDSLICVL